MKNYNFDFIVEGLDDKQASALFDVILAFVEGLDAEMAGGFSPVKEEGSGFYLEQMAKRLEYKRQEQPGGET